MMQTIDQRILIPAPPDTVWATISDIRQNPQWMADCEDIAFISQSRQGPGTRWRSTIRKGHDAIVQVTAWYNGLGYEYTYIDGMPFKQNVGRIRLQELPEGTMVQWTFSFELKGVLAGGKRGIERTIEDNLKGLYKLLKDSSARKPLEAKSLMREDPGVQARASYKPRHPSAEDKHDEIIPSTIAPPFERPNILREPPITDEDNRFIPTAAADRINEPPIAEGDTRPRVAVTPVEPRIAFDEPDFLRDLDQMPKPEDARFMPPAPPAPVRIEEPPIKQDDTKPRFAGTITGEIPAAVVPPDVAEPLKSEEAIAFPVVDADPTPRSRSDALRSDEMRDAIQQAIQDQPPPTPEPAPEVIAPVRTFTPIPAEVIRDAKLDVDDDTASIWEVFKLPRPSETQEMRALAEKSAQRQPLKAEIQPQRMGLRQFHRRRIVRLRRPGQH